jgi:hypothetical protein
MAICVKPLAVPGPPPGPCEAKAVDVASEAASMDAVVIARWIRCLNRNDGMMISCGEKFSEDTATIYAGFENIACV